MIWSKKEKSITTPCITLICKSRKYDWKINFISHEGATYTTIREKIYICRKGCGETLLIEEKFENKRIAKEGM